LRVAELPKLYANDGFGDRRSVWKGFNRCFPSCLTDASEFITPSRLRQEGGADVYFLRHQQVGGETYLWYTRDKNEGQNVPIRERNLTGYLVGVWRFDRGDDTTGEAVPKLNVQIRADKDYVIQTGFTTNFARTFMAGLLGLEQGALKEPLTLVV
jgi:hypothetical protein